MFLKKFKNAFLLLLLTIYIIPKNVLAYSDYIIASGDTVGIKLNISGILVAGSYEIDGKNPSFDAGINKGDIITNINNEKVKSIDDMITIINDCKCKKLNLSYIRNNKIYETTLDLIDEKGVMKTGLYVKDNISGIGTLTYIDPETKLFGALGHEIIDSNTGDIINSNNGSIFSSVVTDITESRIGDPGEKNATFNSNEIKGNVFENTNKGIFGNYLEEFDASKVYKVAKPNEVKKGKAKILTVLSGNTIDSYEIEIKSISKTEDGTKNIVFEITDEKLLKKTNGIIQGMSGSPIIQDEYIVGAVTHVVVDDPHKGYGIFITNMLKEAEN